MSTWRRPEFSYDAARKAPAWSRKWERAALGGSHGACRRHRASASRRAGIPMQAKGFRAVRRRRECWPIPSTTAWSSWSRGTGPSGQSLLRRGSPRELVSAGGQSRRSMPTAVNVRGELALDDVRSGGTDLSRSHQTGPRRYALKLSAGAIARRSRDRGRFHAAVASNLLRGAIRLVGGRSRSYGWCAECLCRGGPRACSQRSTVGDGDFGDDVRHATRLPGLAV